MNWQPVTATPPVAAYYLVRETWRPVPSVAYWSAERGWSLQGMKMHHVKAWHEIPPNTPPPRAGP